MRAWQPGIIVWIEIKTGFRAKAFVMGVNMKRLLIFFVLLLVSGVLLAQSIAGNDAIPECTPEQAVSMIRLLDAAGVTGQIEDTREREPNMAGASFFLFDGYLKAWRDYDEDFKARLPNCALALRFESALYRFLGTQAYWRGANMLNEEDDDTHDFLRLEEEVPGILESATEEFDMIWQELEALAGEAE